MTAVLNSIRVLDFGRYVAGPWCAQILQSMGAEVIRIERPTGGEDRTLFPIGADDIGAYFVHCNRGKRCIGLNPTKPEGREVVARLLRTADVVVANLPDDSLVNMGLDWDTVHSVNPLAVLATATTFGSTGPYAGRLGFDGIGQVMSGATYLSGHRGDPMKSFVPWVDYGTAGNLAIAVMGALMQRGHTGVGSHVEASLLGTALAVSGHVLTEQAVTAVGRRATGNRHPAAGPSDIVATRDGHVIVQVVGNPMFRRWCVAIGRPELADDPRFETDDLRGANGGTLSELVSQWCAQRTTAEVLAELADGTVPAGPLYSPQQALDDPHIASEFMESAFVPGVVGPVPVVAPPFLLSDGGGLLGIESPLLGQHTDEVLRSVGYSDDDIAALRTARIVG